MIRPALQGFLVPPCGSPSGYMLTNGCTGGASSTIANKS